MREDVSEPHWTICDNCSQDIMDDQLVECEKCGQEFCPDCAFPDVHGCPENKHKYPDNRKETGREKGCLGC